MKKTLIASAIMLACTSAANAAWTSADGSLTIGGDAEINFDVINNDGMRNSDGTATKHKTETKLNDDSRIKMAVAWTNAREDGTFINAKIEPLIRTDGTVAVDDAYFMFGREDSWAFQIGRYEAMNLFPLGKDVALFYADGSDGINGSGVYYYMAKEGRGRAGKAGQARIMGEMGNWTAEVSTIYGNTVDLLQGDHPDYNETANTGVHSDHNSFMVRPAVNYLSSSGFVSISIGAEYELSPDSVTLYETAEELNLSDRFGTAATATLNFGNLLWNTSIAMQDAKDAWEAQTYNTNIVYKDAFGLGASYAMNNWAKAGKEDTKSFALYTAYTMPIMNFDNADVTFALSYSDTENAHGNALDDQQTTAFRTRFNYYF